MSGLSCPLGNSADAGHDGDLSADLKKLAEELGLKKLNFQVLRRTMATLDQTKGSGKDLQGVLGYSRPDIAATVYLQQIESGVRQMLDAICSELMAKRELGAGA